MKHGKFKTKKKGRDDYDAFERLRKKQMKNGQRARKDKSSSKGYDPYSYE
jgi:hypothetical protein